MPRSTRSCERWSSCSASTRPCSGFRTSAATSWSPTRVHVPEERLHSAVASILARPQQLAKLPGRRLFRAGKPLVLDAHSAANLGASYELLVPFLERGATCVVVPVRTPTELLATLTLLSLDPQNPITDRRARAGRLDRPAGGDRDRPRAALRAAEVVLGHDAALAAAALAPGAAGPRGRRRLRLLRAGRGRRRRLRLPDAPGRTAGGRARRRDGSRDRRDGGHGDGEVRLPLAQPRASGARRLPRRLRTRWPSASWRRRSSSRSST